MGCGQWVTCKRRSFTLPLAPQGSPFAQAAWRVLQTIPYGETISYKIQASLMGRPSALRASANGRNPIMILIPCHLVIAHDGRLGGYNGGVGIKRFLLELEATALALD
ncbi:MAG: methylated-DNA--[protein]-cysteine S-methyltransferase [Campylobacterales bacterium]|nr:methylated-DNA--[protein]-cysteine S-methyltransferase [Campylobacterales bacterium]